MCTRLSKWIFLQHFKRYLLQHLLLRVSANWPKSHIHFYSLIAESLMDGCINQRQGDNWVRISIAGTRLSYHSSSTNLQSIINAFRWSNAALVNGNKAYSHTWTYTYQYLWAFDAPSADLFTLILSRSYRTWAIIVRQPAKINKIKPS